MTLADLIQSQKLDYLSDDPAGRAGTGLNLQVGLLVARTPSFEQTSHFRIRFQQRAVSLLGDSGPAQVKWRVDPYADADVAQDSAVLVGYISAAANRDNRSGQAAHRLQSLSLEVPEM